VKARCGCGTDELYRSSFDTRLHHAPLKRLELTPSLCAELIRGEIGGEIGTIGGSVTGRSYLGKYRNTTVFTTQTALGSSCAINELLGNYEALYLALHNAGAAAIVVVATEDIPGLGAGKVSPFEKHNKAAYTATPFVAIGTQEGALLEEHLLAEAATVGTTHETHARFSFDENKHQLVYSRVFHYLYTFIIGPAMAYGIFSCIRIGLSRVVNTKNLIVVLELPCNIAILFHVLKGPWSIPKGSSGLVYLLTGHGFIFSGISSSFIVTNFWKGYCDKYSNLSTFTDPATTYPKYAVTIAATGVILDLLLVFLQLFMSLTNVADANTVFNILFAPMSLMYLGVMTNFLITAVRVLRTVDTFDSSKTMLIYLFFASFFVISNVFAFAVLSTGAYKHSEAFFATTLFAMVFGRAGTSLSDISVFAPPLTNSIASGDQDTSAFMFMHADNPANVFLANEKYRAASQLKLRDEELARLAEDARDQRKLVENEKNFIASALHEIRNPLNGIVLGLEYIFEDLGSKLAPDVRSELENVACCSASLDVLLKSVLSLDKILNGKMELVYKAFSPDHLLGGLRKMTTHLANKATVMHLEGVRPEEYKAALVLGSPAQLNLVLLNLLSNAAKFTERGKITYGCTMEEETADDLVVSFFVCDTGVGVPKDKLCSAFTLRSQVGDSGSQSKGFGIGLSVAKRLVELMGGRIEVQSPVREADAMGGVGSQFSFSIKCKKATNIVPELPAFVVSSPRTTAATISDLRNLRVLVVDDSSVNRSLLKRRFTTGGFKELKWRVDLAKIGEEALEIVSKNRYDFIVMDENMHEAGGKLLGTEVTAKIREMERARGEAKPCMVFGCSGNCTEDDICKSSECGQDFFWPKPVPGSKDAIADIVRVWNAKGAVKFRKSEMAAARSFNASATVYPEDDLESALPTAEASPRATP
jgi:signal transduction histidine kinase/CheY-like chemotaxis protein